MALRPACLINIRYCMQHGGVSSKRPLLMNAVVIEESAQESIWQTTYSTMYTTRYTLHISGRRNYPRGNLLAKFEDGATRAGVATLDFEMSHDELPPSTLARVIAHCCFASVHFLPHSHVHLKATISVPILDLLSTELCWSHHP